MNIVRTAVVTIAAVGTLTVNAWTAEKDVKMHQPSGEHKYTNHLINENSPYLLQHAHNPVEWYPWGDEALARAKAEDKPIFLSIGYAACHWCHVMEHESFENETIAAVMNEHFINIKVDREQRPDLDQIYMAFTTAMTGSGGWPMSVFLTPDLKPFFAGTYFPPDDRYGRPGFHKVLTEISGAYQEQKQQIYESSDAIFEQVNGQLSSNPAGGLLNMNMVKRSAEVLMRGFDQTYGGFGQAPKFPHAMELSLFLRHYQKSGDLAFLQAVDKALTAMADGGIYDQLGGGFARYSTDARWLVPHFEKMLYDNALLVTTYAEAYRITGNERYREIVRETLDFILREMTDPTGGFYSALDADSEGEEGKFYVWQKAEIETVLGDRADRFCRYYDVSGAGNWEGKNILNIHAGSQRVRAESGNDEFNAFLDGCRKDLLTARADRVRPHTDDKTLTSWNGLALSAFCHGYQITGEQRFLDAAVKNAAFIRDELLREGTLTHSYRDGRYSTGEFLEDYAFFLRGLLDLYETDLQDGHRWLVFARELAGRSVALFMDETGRLYLRPEGQSDLIMRPIDETDGSIPAAGSLLMASLLKLERLTGDKELLQAAEKAMRATAGQIARYPGGMSSAVLAVDYYTSDKIEIVLVGGGDELDRMVREVYGRYMPHKVLAVSNDGAENLPLFEGRESSDGAVVAFVCRNSVCRLPVDSLEAFKKQLDGI